MLSRKITFRGMEHSDATQTYVEEKLAKVEKFLVKEPPPVFIDVVLGAARTHHHHRVELFLKAHRLELVSHAEGPELYPVIDSAIDKLCSEYSHKKERLLDERKNPHTAKRDFEAE